MHTKTLIQNGFSSKLSEAKLAALRADYQVEVAISIGKKFLSEPFPLVSPWASFVMDTLYNDQALDALQRELTLIALLASRKQMGTLAVHIYWALMEGGTAEQIAHIITLSGTYTGLDNYTLGIRALHKTLELLAQLAQQQQTTTPEVFQAIVQLFPA